MKEEQVSKHMGDKMEILEVGMRIPEFKRHNEETIFDIADDGATMYVFFNNPSASEIEQFKSGKNFEIRFNLMYDVIMITTKIGNLNWMDAPYTPHLSKHLTKFTIPNEGEGLALTLILVDANNGEIKSIRLLGLSEKFTRSLLGVVMDLRMKEFDRNLYDKNLQKVFNYTTKQIVGMSKEYCKII